MAVRRLPLSRRTARIERIRGSPPPVTNLRHILAEPIYVAFVLDEFAQQLLLQMLTLASRLRQPVDDVHDEMEAVHVVQHGHIKRSGDRAFLLVSANVKIAVI